MTRMFLGVAVMAGLLVAAPASAQTTRRVGVVFGLPSQVGILWHIGDRIAIRPEIGFSTASSKTELDVSLAPLPGGTRISSSNLESDSVSAELNILVTLTSWDAVKLYLAPSYGYTRTSSSIDTSVTIGASPAIRTVSESSVHGHSGAVSFGAQFTPHERFAVFGEAGLRYTRTRSEVASVSRSRSLGNTGSVGVVVYF